MGGLLLRPIRASILLLAWTALGQVSNPELVLEHVLAKMRAEYGNLPKYTCTETVNRRYYIETQSMARGCDALIAQKRKGNTALQLIATDRLRLDVEVAENGREMFAWPGAEPVGAQVIQALTDGGPFGTGPFGPFLADIFVNHGVIFHSDGIKRMNHRNLLEYRFTVPLNASHYEVQTAAKSQVISYDGRFWVDPESEDLQSIEVRTSELPSDSGHCEATTVVDFQRMRIGQGDYLIQRGGKLRAVGRMGVETENVTDYADCHEFRAEAIVRFGEDAPRILPHPTVERRDSLPAGLPVRLLIETRIDTSSASAGDPIVAKVVEPVKDIEGKLTLVQPGASVRGRVTHIEHHLRDPEYFLLSISFDQLISGGAAMPFSAILDVRKPESCLGQIRPKLVESHGGRSGGGLFVFPGRHGRYVTPANCPSDWITTLSR